LTLASSASGQFLLKDFNAVFCWSAFFVFEKEHDLSCFFFDGMKSIIEQFAEPKAVELHGENITRTLSQQ